MVCLKATVMAMQRLNCAVMILCILTLLSVVSYLCEQCCLQYCHKFVLMYLSAAVVNCYSPQYFPNGTVTLVNGSITLNSTVKYECRMGLQLVGSANRICQSNGQWSGQEPRCEGKFHL